MLVTKFEMLLIDFINWENRQQNEKSPQHNAFATNISNQSPTSLSPTDYLELMWHSWLQPITELNSISNKMLI